MAKAATQPVLFVLSVDTEEQWDWSGPFPQKSFNVSHDEQLPAFQEICASSGIKPTYFVDYAVAESQQCSQILKQILATEQAEIGAHLHPWCNPPYFGDTDEASSHVVNLPVEQVRQKLQSLVTLLSEKFGQAPKAFRTGRWGIDANVMQLLVEQGFTVDSSVYPYYKNEYFSCHGAPELPYWPDLSNPLLAANQQHNYELPITAGFNWHNQQLANRVHQCLSHPWINWCHLIGLAWHTKLLRKTYLSPELSSLTDMQNLVDVRMRNGVPVLHVFLHSSSLVDNPNSLVGNNNAFHYLTSTLQELFAYVQDRYDVKCCTISEASLLLNKAL